MTGPLRPMQCARCGKDVSKQVGPGRRGDYVCEACRAKINEDPLEALKGMVEAAALKGVPGDLARLDRYEFIRELGRGGMGVVYLVRIKPTGRLGALKVILPEVAVSEHSRKLFTREIESLDTLRHQNLLDLIEHGAEGPFLYMVTEYCAGGSVDTHMSRRRGKLLVDEAVTIVLQALEGLVYAHGRGFVHRDLKPDNVLLTAEEGGVAKIADLGLTKCYETAGLSGYTVTGTVAGTPHFVPRDQIINYKYATPTADVWSMAATLFHMLTGRFLREFPPGVDPIWVILDTPTRPVREIDPGLPPRLAAVLDRALLDEPGGRYRNAAELRDALKAAL